MPVCRNNLNSKVNPPIPSVCKIDKVEGAIVDVQTLGVESRKTYAEYNILIPSKYSLGTSSSG